MPASEDLERFLPQIIAALNDSALAAHPDARVFCPAGTGGHVDHVLTRQAVEQVVNRDAIVYYDEYPYSARPTVSASATRISVAGRMVNAGLSVKDMGR